MTHTCIFVVYDNFQICTGEECEPFIMMLPNEELQNLLVTLNQRYLIEKDIEGNVKEMLDLKCLLSYKVRYFDIDLFFG